MACTAAVRQTDGVSIVDLAGRLTLAACGEGQQRFSRTHDHRRRFQLELVLLGGTRSAPARALTGAAYKTT
jgi:hypothetical protein